MPERSSVMRRFFSAFKRKPKEVVGLCGKPNCQKMLLQQKGVDTSGMTGICETRIASGVLNLGEMYNNNREGYDAYIKGCADEAEITISIVEGRPVKS